MKKTFVLLSLLLLVGCKKKSSESAEETATTTTGSTTSGGSTTGNPFVNPAFAVELTSTNTDHSYSYSSARFYESSASAVLIDQVKSDNKIMGQYPGDEYRYANASSNYTAAVLWDLSSSREHIPDTSFYSPAFPGIGFTKNTSLTYDSTKDFTIAIDPGACDSMFITLGTITKKIRGKSGVNSVTFKPGDGVKANTFDTAEVVVEVATMNYSVFTVRARKWRVMSVTTAQSHYKYK
ncbi:hypothetical protein CNR22_16080 [Sphingobacteriaceae bacterium]|nr:hypothetical protein CNR22_16080 [Sphingobacteriaceae bacterium]